MKTKRLVLIGIGRKGFKLKGKTCTICGELKGNFCDACQDQVAEEDGLLVNVCSDCCQCEVKQKQICLNYGSLINGAPTR